MAADAADTEPTTLAEALARPDGAQWQTAMKEELDSIETNRVYELVELPPGRKAIGCKYVFKIKRNADGTVERYKARLVAKGFSQKEGVDFTETFAPVAKFQSIRTVLALAAAQGYPVHQMDVKTAFLNGDIEEEIYMQQPEGTVKPGQERLVWRLRKALYGLKQAPRMWYRKLDQYLQELGFTRSDADHSVYVRRDTARGSMVIIAVYVDDLVITGDTALVTATKAALGQRFDMKDLGEVHWLLGIEVARRGDTFQLSQRKYIADMLEAYGMTDARPVTTPADPHTTLTADMSPQSDEERSAMASVPYRNAVGSIMYLMVGTRPDLAAAVSAVSRFMADPGQQHWTAVKRILRYLRGTADWTLTLGGAGGGAVELSGYCDADWAGDLDTRRSTTGYAFSLGRGTVSWCSKRQPTVALSSTEAEYMSASQAAREALWLRRLMADLGFGPVGATTIRCDNQGALALAKNPVHHQRTKHIDVQHHFIRELVEQGTVQLVYCATDDMVADVLTKPLPRDKHWRCCRALGLEPKVS
jgi:hypothetical protein